MRPCYIQIKKAELVPTKKGTRQRTDWHLIYTMQYEDTTKLFTSLGGSPIETDLDFIQAISNDFEEGIYSCVAGKKRRKGFWSFLLFVIREDGTAERFFRRNAFDKRRRNKRNSIIADLKDLQSKSTLTDAAEIQNKIDDEIAGEMFDQIGNKIFVDGKRYGPWPYLKSVMRVGKFAPLHKEKIKQQGFFGEVEETEVKDNLLPIDKQGFFNVEEKTEEEIEREEQQRQADEEEQQRNRDTFKIY